MTPNTPFWNSVEITKPPKNTSRINISYNDVQKLKHIFDSITATLSDLNPLHTEGAMLSRTIYKLKSKFNSDIGFQKMTKVDRAMLHYLSGDFLGVYSQFSSMMPAPDQMPGTSGLGTETYMPTRQMLEWVLVRTQGFARLFCVVAITCEESARFWMDRITRGQMWNVSALVMGVLGRIWTYAKYLVINACSWYAQLRPYLKILKPFGLSWIPKDYVFPEDLNVWLNASHITAVQGVKPTDSSLSLKSVFALMSTNSSEDWKNEVTSPALAMRLEEDIDLGEAISRDEALLIRDKLKKKEKKVKKKLKGKVEKEEKSSDNVLKLKPTKLKKKDKTKIIKQSECGKKKTKLKKKTKDYN